MKDGNPKPTEDPFNTDHLLTV